MGAIMNSWISTPVSACAPPLRMFIMGTGRRCALGPPKYLNNGNSAESAAALATARDAPKIAFAPSRLLFGVPSRSIMTWSTVRWSSADKPIIESAISPSTPATVAKTPLPPYREPPSRFSAASKAPVEAPEGTAARETVSSSRRTSTSTVGLPRESRISRAIIASMIAMGASLVSDHEGPISLCCRIETKSRKPRSSTTYLGDHMQHTRT